VNIVLSIALSTAIVNVVHHRVDSAFLNDVQDIS